MRTRLLPLLLVVATALVAAACSASTTIETGERLLADPTAVPTAAPTVAPPANPTAAPDPTEVATDDPTPATEDEPEEVFGVGGDEQVGSLVSDCEGGSDQACDILFQVTDFGSDEEAVALNCGGRGEPSTSLFCTSDINNDGENLWFDEDSPALPGIAEDCEGGDMTACDFLFFRSPVGSQYEELGNGCAGLTEVALPDCRTQFDTD